MKFTGLQGVWAYIHTCARKDTYIHMRSIRWPMLGLCYWWRWLINVLRRWMPHTNTHTERRATSFFYHGGDETTDQSRLSAAWQRRKSEGVIEEVSWPCGAVSVACLSGGRHWWTVETERERESCTHTLSHTHTYMPSHYRGLKSFPYVSNSRMGFCQYQYHVTKTI